MPGRLRGRAGMGGPGPYAPIAVASRSTYSSSARLGGESLRVSANEDARGRRGGGDAVGDHIGHLDRVPADFELDRFPLLGRQDCAVALDSAVDAWRAALEVRARLETAWRHDDDANAELAYLGGQAEAQCLERTLACRVRPQVRARREARQGGDVDDRSGPLRPHRRQHQSCEAK